MRIMARPNGWRREPARHSLAARGVRSSFPQASAYPPMKSSIEKGQLLEYRRVAEFDYNIKVGDEVEARFTHIVDWKRFRARVAKVNKNTVRVYSLEPDKPWPGDKPGREFVIQRMPSGTWSWNNGIFPAKSPSKSSSYEPSEQEVRDLMRLHGMGKEESVRYLKKKHSGGYDDFYGGDWWRTGKDPPKSYSKKEAAVMRHLGYDHPNINEKQLAKLRRQVMRSYS